MASSLFLSKDQYRFLHQVLWEFIITHLDVELPDTDSQEDNSTIDESSDSFDEHYSCPVNPQTDQAWFPCAAPKSQSLHFIKNDLSRPRAEMDNLQPSQGRRVQSKSLGINVFKDTEPYYFTPQPSPTTNRCRLNQNLTGPSKHDQSELKLAIDHLTSSNTRRDMGQTNEFNILTPQLSPRISQPHLSQSRQRHTPMVGGEPLLPSRDDSSGWPRESRVKHRLGLLDQNVENSRCMARFSRIKRQPYESVRGSPEPRLENHLWYRSEARARPMNFRANQQYEFYQQKISPMESEYKPRTSSRDKLQSFSRKMSKSMAPTSKFSNLSRDFDRRDFSKSSLFPWPSGLDARDLSSRSQPNSDYRLSTKVDKRRSSLVRSLHRLDDLHGRGSRSEISLQQPRVSDLDEFLRSRRGRLTLKDLEPTSAKDVRSRPRRSELSYLDGRPRQVSREFSASGRSYREYPMNSWPGKVSNAHGLHTLEEETLEMPKTSEQYEGSMISRDNLNGDRFSQRLRRTFSKPADDLADVSGLSRDQDMDMDPDERPISRPPSREVNIVSSLGSKLYSNTEDWAQANLEADDFRDEMVMKQSVIGQRKSRVSAPQSSSLPRRSERTSTAQLNSLTQRSRVWRNSSKSLKPKLSTVDAEVEGKSELVRHEMPTRRQRDTKRSLPDKHAMSYSLPEEASYLNDVTGRNASTKLDGAGHGDLRASGRTFRQSTDFRADQVPANDVMENGPVVKGGKSSPEVRNTLIKTKSSMKSRSSVGNEKLHSVSDTTKSLQFKTFPVASFTKDPYGEINNENWRGEKFGAAARNSDSVGPSSPSKLVGRQSSLARSSVNVEIPVQSHKSVRHLENRSEAILVDDFLPEPHVVESNFGAVSLRSREEALSPFRGSSRNVQLPTDRHGLSQLPTDRQGLSQIATDRQGFSVKEESLDLKAYTGSRDSSRYVTTQGGSRIQTPTLGRDGAQHLQDESQHVVTQFRVCATSNKTPSETGGMGGNSYLGGKEKSVVCFETSEQAIDHERPCESQVRFSSSFDQLNDTERVSPAMTRADLSFTGQQIQSNYQDKEKTPNSCNARSGSREVIANNSFDESSSPSEYDVSFRIK